MVILEAKIAWVESVILITAGMATRTLTADNEKINDIYNLLSRKEKSRLDNGKIVNIRQYETVVALSNLIW